MEKEDRTTENNMERSAQQDLNRCGLRAGEATDRAMWRRKIISRTGDCTRLEKTGQRRYKNVLLSSCN